MVQKNSLNRTKNIEKVQFLIPVSFKNTKFLDLMQGLVRLAVTMRFYVQKIRTAEWGRWRLLRQFEKQRWVASSDWWLVTGIPAHSIAIIYTSRRFYIFMRRTTISHFSFLISNSCESFTHNQGPPPHWLPLNLGKRWLNRGVRFYNTFYTWLRHSLP